MSKRAAVLFFAAFAVGCGGSGDVGSNVDDATAASADGAPRITFAGDWTNTTSRDLHAGDQVEIAYDPARLAQCGGEQGGIPQFAITGHASLNGHPEATFTVVGLNAPASPPKVTVDEPGELDVWFEISNRWGCHAYDSNFGSNFDFDVSLPPDGPGFVGNAASVVSRATCNDGHGCDADRHPLTQAFVFDTWARQRAAITAAYFDVWQEGVTDFDNADLWKELDVEVHYRFADADAFETAYVNFEKRVNHDARYALNLRSLDPYAAPGCPDVPMTPTPDGQYVATPFSFYFTVNGIALRPAGADPLYHGTFSDYRARLDACSSN